MRFCIELVVVFVDLNSMIQDFQRASGAMWIWVEHGLGIVSSLVVSLMRGGGSGCVCLTVSVHMVFTAVLFVVPTEELLLLCHKLLKGWHVPPLVALRIVDYSSFRGAFDLKSLLMHIAVLNHCRFGFVFGCLRDVALALVCINRPLYLVQGVFKGKTKLVAYFSALPS